MLEDKLLLESRYTGTKILATLVHIPEFLTSPTEVHYTMTEEAFTVAKILHHIAACCAD